MLGQINGYVEEMYTGHNIVSAFGTEKETIDAFEIKNEDLYQSAWKAQFMSSTLMPITQGMGNLGYTAVAVVSGILVINGRITIGMIQAFIHALPGGYEFVLEENAANLAQGERQLLMIARAILANNPIMVLDEATSSVDTRTEVLIQEAMATLMKGRTSFVIAHRLSTIRDADRIIYMEDGDIKETGSHQSLMESGGFYAKLYNSQFAGENEQ